MNTVRVRAGRNKGQIGTVTAESKDGAVYVDFKRKLLVNEGFGSIADYEDGYWVKREFVEAVA